MVSHRYLGEMKQPPDIEGGAWSRVEQEILYSFFYSQNHSKKKQLPSIEGVALSGADRDRTL